MVVASSKLIDCFRLLCCQVELVSGFVSAAQKGQSLVHQLIMGAGKTVGAGENVAVCLWLPS